MTAISTNTLVEGAKPRSNRRALMFAGPVVLLLAAGGYWLSGGRYVSTENAYLHQARITVSASVGGRIAEVMIHDNQNVTSGTTLFTVDPEPFRLALQQAEVAVAAARISVEQLKLAYATTLTQMQLSQDDASYQKSERTRQEDLRKKGVSSETALDDARHSEQLSLDKLNLAQHSVAMALAALGGKADIETDAHPAVQAALIARDQAALNLAHATVTAPADGVISQAASFKPGAMVAPGQSLFALVEAGDVWVEANFKETQLQDIQVGQSAEVEIDLLGGRKFEALVETIGAGTGSEFSLLPAQNATGNWVKVTQRVPVRLRLVDPEAAAGLASGLSASVTVDTGLERHLADLVPSLLK